MIITHLEVYLLFTSACCILLCAGSTVSAGAGWICQQSWCNAEMCTAYAAIVQVHTMEYPDGFIRGDFNSSLVVDAVVTPQPSSIATVPQTS